MTGSALQLFRTRAPEEPISQGDVLLNVHCIDVTTGAAGVTHTAMVISHGCDMDKPASITCYVVQVVPLSTLPPSGHGAVRQGKVAAVMHLPTLESLGGESFADLRKIFRVPLTQLCDAELRTEQNGDRVRVLSHPHNRVAALSDEGLEVLHGQLMFFFTRRKF